MTDIIFFSAALVGAILAALLIVISIILFVKKIHKLAFILFIPSLITIVVTVIFFLWLVSRPSSGGFGDMGAGFIMLPVVSLYVFVFSFLLIVFLLALWKGIVFVIHNRSNKEQRAAVILTFFLVVASSITASYLVYSFIRNVDKEKQATIEDPLFWENVFITNNVSLPIDIYKKHLSKKSKEFIAHELHYDYDAKISPEMLTVLYKLGFDVADHRNINPKLAEELYESLKDKPNYSSSTVISRLARNPGIPLSILEKMAESQDGRVLGELAMNSSASVDILQKLSSNPWFEIQMRAQETLAKHPNTPASRLKELSTINFDTCKAVAGNPFAPTELLEELAKDSEASVSSRALVSIGRSPKTKKERLAELSQDKDDRIREAVAENKAAPLDLLTTLLHDKEMKVSIAALKNLAGQNPVPEEILLPYLDRLGRGSLTTEAHLPKWLRKELIRINKDSSGEIYFIIKRLPVSEYSEDELKEVLELVPQHKISLSKDREMPIKLLKILSMDANKEVSDSAKTTLKSFEVEL